MTRILYQLTWPPCYRRRKPLFYEETFLFFFRFKPFMSIPPQQPISAVGRNSRNESAASGVPLPYPTAEVHPGGTRVIVMSVITIVHLLTHSAPPNGSLPLAFSSSLHILCIKLINKLKLHIHIWVHNVASSRHFYSDFNLVASGILAS